MSIALLPRPSEFGKPRKVRIYFSNKPPSPLIPERERESARFGRASRADVHVVFLPSYSPTLHSPRRRPACVHCEPTSPPSLFLCVEARRGQDASWFDHRSPISFHGCNIHARLFEQYSRNTDSTKHEPQLINSIRFEQYLRFTCSSVDRGGVFARLGSLQCSLRLEWRTCGRGDPCSI